MIKRSTTWGGLCDAVHVVRRFAVAVRVCRRVGDGDGRVDDGGDGV